MIFDSFQFLLFFIIVFFIYYFPLREKKTAQNVFLLLASYMFYGIAAWKMIPILFIATVLFYSLGIAISKTRNEKFASIITTLGVLCGVGLLLYFKYMNFFIESFSHFFQAIGFSVHWNTLSIAMPLGISFFTFKLISYLVDIHRGKILPVTNFTIFATYISFFPTIISGPIDRPNNFIPQLQKTRHFDEHLAVDGCRQILWGLFKKLAIADSLAPIINTIWKNHTTEAGSTLAITAILYTFQMYTDFSGYSDMAIGIGKTMGFRITKNFNYPFFATNIAEYWRRWHISLTSWLTDYVFIPLNIKFRNWGKMGLILAILINMLTVGLWHGAHWTFAIFGLYHGLLFIPLILSGSFFKKKQSPKNRYKYFAVLNFFKMAGTFILVTIGLIIFRANSISQAYSYFHGICNKSLWSVPLISNTHIVYILAFLIIEWIQQEKEHGLVLSNVKQAWIRWCIYSILIVICFRYFPMDTQQSFIYFQF